MEVQKKLVGENTSPRITLRCIIHHWELCSRCPRFQHVLSVQFKSLIRDQTITYIISRPSKVKTLQYYREKPNCSHHEQALGDSGEEKLPFNRKGPVDRELKNGAGGGLGGSRTEDLIWKAGEVRKLGGQPGGWVTAPREIIIIHSMIFSPWFCRSCNVH